MRSGSRHGYRQWSPWRTVGARRPGGTGDRVLVATHEAGSGDFGTAILLVTVALFATMVVGFVMLRRETRRRRQKETLR